MKLLRLFVEFSLVVAGVVSAVGCSDVTPDDGDSTFCLVTCGGSPPPEIITTANAQDVAATAVRADYQALDVMTKIGGQVFPTLPSAPDLVSCNSKYELFATVVATGQPVTETCAVNGSVTVSGQPYNDVITKSERDGFVLVFDTCDDGDGYTLDGSFWLIVYSLDGDPRTDVFSLLYAVKDMTLTVASGMEKYTASASALGLGWNSVGFPEIELSIDSDPFLIISSQSLLQLSSQADVYSFELGGGTLTVSADISVSTTLRKASSDVESTFFPGPIHYGTAVPLQTPDGRDPQSGEILISDGNTFLRIVIESSDVVRLDIDLGHDTIVDEVQYTTWADLRG